MLPSRGGPSIFPFRLEPIRSIQEEEKMKFTIVKSKSVGIARFGLAVACFAVPICAQQPAATPAAKPKQAQYTFKDLGTLGGTFSQAYFVNTAGSAGGVSTTSDGYQHAFLWRNGSMKDLGTLGGLNSVDFASPNEWGQLAGEAETSTLDPNGEDYCGFGTHLVCLPFIWEPTSNDSGVMMPLPPLKGGVNAQAAWLNNRGDMVGSSENGVTDSTCPGSAISPQVKEFKPVVWYKPFSWYKAEIRELPTLTGEPDGVALAINDQGNAAGSTGSCGSFDPNNYSNLSQVLPSRPVFWKNGNIFNLKGLGGELGNVAFAINNFDDVVGVSDLPGDLNFHGFLWKNGHVTDLQPLDGDANSVALGINDKGEIVGLSLDQDFNPRAVIWHNGSSKPVDLSSLATSDSTIIPFVAEWMNIRGEIAGFGLDTTIGDIHAYLATPNSDGGKFETAQPESNRRVKIYFSAQIRELLQQSRGRRFTFRTAQPQ
jgi:probable HAF family extracellular repeat protein